MQRSMISFINNLKSYVELDDEDIEKVKSLVTLRKFQKGEHLLEAGEVSSAFYYNAAGFVRLYYLHDGEEKTTYFYGVGSYISAYTSFMRQTPSSFYLQATEDSELIVIGLEESQKLLDYSPKFEKLARVAMEEEMMSLQEIIASLLTLRPEERYAELLENNPEIFQKVPQIQIASFIGVQPESLSRIKKRHMERS